MKSFEDLDSEIIKELPTELSNNHQELLGQLNVLNSIKG